MHGVYVKKDFDVCLFLWRGTIQNFVSVVLECPLWNSEYL